MMREHALETVYDMARADDRVVFIGSDLGAGTLDGFRRDIPGRFFMEGVHEQHIVGMAAGLALDGFLPYVNTISSFLVRRALEQIVVDACLHNVPVRLLANGAGLAYGTLGPTHQAIDDLAIMRAIPNMTVLAPYDDVDVRQLLWHTLDWPTPVYVRLSRESGQHVLENGHDSAIGKATALREGSDVLILSTGVLAHEAVAAADTLRAVGIGAGVLQFSTVKPLDSDALAAHASGASLIVSVEEHVRAGGFGSAVLECLSDMGRLSGTPVLTLALGDAFCDRYGAWEALIDHFGLSAASIARTIQERVSSGSLGAST